MECSCRARHSQHRGDGCAVVLLFVAAAQSFAGDRSGTCDCIRFIPDLSGEAPCPGLSHSRYLDRTHHARVGKRPRAIFRPRLAAGPVGQPQCQFPDRIRDRRSWLSEFPAARKNLCSGRHFCMARFSGFIASCDSHPSLRHPAAYNGNFGVQWKRLAQGG